MVGIAAIASDAIRLDYHLEEFVRWHTPLVDALVVNVNIATQDDTLLLLRYLTKHYPNLTVMEADWGDPTSPSWLGPQKLAAIRGLPPGWRILLDIDEFLNVPSREILEECLVDRSVRHLHPISYTHFVGSYKTMAIGGPWPTKQWRIYSSQIPDVEAHVSTDPHGSNLIGVEPIEAPALGAWHFGCVRQRTVLLQKWEKQMQRNFGRGSVATSDWTITAEGEVIQLVPALPGSLPTFFQTPEFVRDEGPPCAL